MLILAFLLPACQQARVFPTTPISSEAQVTPTVTRMIPAPTDTPVVPTAIRSATIAATESPSITVSPSPDLSTPHQQEWLAFVDREFQGLEKPGVFAFEDRADATISFVNHDGSEILQPGLVDPRVEIGRSLAWSPDGRYLLFDGIGSSSLQSVPTDDGRGIPDLPVLYLMDLLARTINGFTSRYEYLNPRLGSPSWMPVDTHFVTTLATSLMNSNGEVQQTHNLFLLDADTLKRKRLTTSPSRDLHPAWSPDGQWIAFVRYSPETICPPLFPSNQLGCNKVDLHIVRPDGSESKLLRESIYVQYDRDSRDSVYNAPAWSPDSRWLAVLVGDEQPDIALVNVENGETQPLAAHPAQDLYPTWSPDGSHLVFVSDRDGDEDIYLVSVDGTGLVNLTDNPASEFSPIWSPSGRLIAFLSDREEPGAYKLYVMNADGTGQRKLHDGYVLTRPAWFPLVDADLREFIGLGND